MKDKSKKSTYSTTFGIDPTCGNDKRMVCANNQNVEVYEE